MTKERVKTALLISLFMISIFLANQIWIELPDSFFPSFGDGLNYKESKNLFSEIVSPEKYLVNFNGNQHTVLYSDNDYELWKMGRALLVELFENQNYTLEIIDENDINSYREGLSLDYFFSEKLHIYILSKTLELDIHNSINDKIEEIKDIHISLGKEPFTVLSDGEIHLKISPLEKTSRLDEEINNIRKVINTISKENFTKFFTMEYMFQINNQQFIPRTMNYSLPNIIVNSEIDVYSENVDYIARYFFQNLDYARPFVEANGATIYIYNQEVLKIHQDGMVEYSNLNEETVRNRELFKSLNTAVNFISNHLGWPEDSYLKSIEPIEFEDSKGYRFRFTYKISGAQIMLNEEHSMKAPIEIDVFNDYVKSYKRLVRVNSTSINNNTENKSMLSPIDILFNKENYDFIRRKYIEKNNLKDEDINEDQIRYDIFSSIDDLYLAYCKSSTRKISSDLGLNLTPAWVIEINGITFIFDAHEGKSLDEF